jgi:hypothetical protein
MTRMLLWKAWLETRGRFLSALIVLTILGISTVLRAPATIAGWESVHTTERMSYPLYIWLSLSHGFLQFLWIVAVVILGLGGLLRERSAGSSTFTLSLPMPRAAHVRARAYVGAAEATILGFIPGVIVVALSPVAGFSYPLKQALIFGALLVTAGFVFYALAFFLSHVLHGEYAAPGVALALIAAFYILTKIPGFEWLNVFDAMDGKLNLVDYTFFMGSSYPITTVLASLATALVFIMVSAIRTNRIDF